MKFYWEELGITIYSLATIGTLYLFWLLMRKIAGSGWEGHVLGILGCAIIVLVYKWLTWYMPKIDTTLKFKGKKDTQE